MTEYTQLYPAISVRIKSANNDLYKYTYEIKSPDGKLYPLGFLDDHNKYPVEKTSNKSIEEYNWFSILEFIRTNNAVYCDNCKNTTKLIVIIEDCELFSNGLRTMYQENVQLVTRKEYAENVKAENTIVPDEDLESKDHVVKWYKRLWYSIVPKKQITHDSFFQKNRNFVPLCAVAVIVLALAIFIDKDPAPQTIDKDFAAKMVVQKKVIKHQVATEPDTNSYTISTKPTLLNPVIPVDTVITSADTVDTNTTIAVVDSRSPYQRMLDSLKGERMRADSLAEFLRKNRQIKIEFIAKIDDGYTKREVSTNIIVDSIRSADITNMSIAINDMASNMSREFERERSIKKGITNSDDINKFTLR